MLRRSAGRLTVGCAVVFLLLTACSAESRTEGADRHAPATPRSDHSVPGTIEGLPQWQPRGTLATPRDDFATAVVGDEVWAFGGMTGDRGNRLDSIEVYDTTTDKWRLDDKVLPEGIASFEGAAIGRDVFLFGGLDIDSEPSGFSWKFDTVTGKWHELPPLPTARYAHTVTRHDGRIYVIGGETVSGPVTAVDVFDPRTETWSSGTPMPQPRGSHDAVSADGVIYVLGGWLDAGPTDLVQTYDPTDGRWRDTTPLPEPVSRAGATVLDGRLWVSYHDFSAALDLETGRWAPVNPLTVSRHGLGYVAVDDTIYGIAGCSENPLRDVRTVDALIPL